MEFTDGHQDSPLPTQASYFTGTGALERLMEKERIREEIRLEMAMARRAVEAEAARREVVMEQYALRGGLSLRSSQHLMDFVVSPQPKRRLINLGARVDEMALGGDMPLLLNRELQGQSRGREFVSFTRPQKKKLLILEDKAVEENKAATKRKALSPPPQADEEIDLPLVKIENKTKENRFYCEICRVSSNSELSLQGHLGGRKHKSKEAALSAKKEAAEENPKFPFWCCECKVGAHSEDVMLGHEKGKRHVNRLKAREGEKAHEPESKFSVLVNDFAEWVDAYGKESISDEPVDKAGLGESEGV